MSNSLVIGGVTFNNVAGFKATDNGSSVQTFIQPSGSMTISANGTYDITNYASVEVATPSAAEEIEWVEYTAAEKTTSVPALLNIVFPSNSDSDTSMWYGELVATASGGYDDYNLISFATIGKSGASGGGIRMRTSSGVQNYAPTGSTWTVRVNIGDTVKVGRLPK